jgi:hypothetical protein
MTDWNKRAAEASAFRWLPGMRRLRHCPGYGDHHCFQGRWTEAKSPSHNALFAEGCVPDLTDPATQGAILFGILFPAGWRIGCWSDDKVALRHMRADIVVRLKDFGSDGEENIGPEVLARALEATSPCTSDDEPGPLSVEDIAASREGAAAVADRYRRLRNAD